MQEVMKSEEFFINGAYFWFKGFEEKIAILPLLGKVQCNERDLEDEAYILCMVYLDWLSGGYKSCLGKGNCDLGSSKKFKKTLFYKLLATCSKNSFFQKINFHQLLSDLKKIKNCKSVFQNISNFFELDMELKNRNQTKSYSKIYTEKEVFDFLEGHSILSHSDLKLLKEEIKKGAGSVAHFCYEEIRCSVVHEWGRPGISIADIPITFDLLYSTLQEVYKFIKEDYVKTGKFMGHECEHLFNNTPLKNIICT